MLIWPSNSSTLLYTFMPIASNPSIPFMTDVWAHIVCASRYFLHKNLREKHNVFIIPSRLITWNIIAHWARSDTRRTLCAQRVDNCPSQCTLCLINPSAKWVHCRRSPKRTQRRRFAQEILHFMYPFFSICITREIYIPEKHAIWLYCVECRCETN